MLLALEIGGCAVLLLVILMVAHHDDGPAGKVAEAMLGLTAIGAVLAGLVYFAQWSGLL